MDELQKLQDILVLDKIPNWDTISETEKQFCYDLTHDFELLKSVLRDVIEKINAFDGDMGLIEEVKSAYPVACDKAIKLMVEILNDKK